jgi:hypothetical protein
VVKGIELHTVGKELCSSRCGEATGLESFAPLVLQWSTFWPVAPARQCPVQVGGDGKKAKPALTSQKNIPYLCECQIVYRFFLA